MKEQYTAIHELHEKLTKLGIPHKMIEFDVGYQIVVPENHIPNKFEGDAIQHQFSYGNEKDLIEVWGFGLKDPVGNLTADEALKYFVEWHKKGRKRGKK